MLGKLRPILLITLVGGTVFAKPPTKADEQAQLNAALARAEQLAPSQGPASVRPQSRKVRTALMLDTATPAPAPAPTPGADVKAAEGLANLSPGEMDAQSRSYIQAMNDVQKRIVVLQESARRSKDIIKLNCVTDKLTQTKVNLNLADTGIQGMNESFARKDNTGAQHQFARLTILNQKTTLLGAEAENCVGEDLTFIGQAKVDVEVDPSIPQDDPSQPSIPPIIIERPPEASPYR